MHTTRLIKANSGNKRLGFALRCVMALRFFLPTGSLGARSYPLSYVYSGYYYWGTGMLYHQTTFGYYWSSNVHSSAAGYRLDMNSTRLIKASTSNMRGGFALRCITAHCPASIFVIASSWTNKAII